MEGKTETSKWLPFVILLWLMTNIVLPIEIDHKFLVSGHSFLPCDQDFGLIEKQKKHHQNIFVPNDWHSVIKNARKKIPFIL